MGKPQIITSPSGEELVVVPRRDYEDLVDTAVARRVDAALASGREELLSTEETAALLATPAPLAFWRKKRGQTQTQLAEGIGVSQNFLSDLERGKARGDVTLYAKLARHLQVTIEDLIPEGGERMD
ncbi:MAG: helix-turn-helix domain-containing protein [Pseudolabrys sp.]|nr:helix-turn-helix domain-containing protein [Pseudolabrys sp.]